MAAIAALKDTEAAGSLVFYRVAYARFAGMFSNDLEGHAPSWPCAQMLMTRRSASLHNTILLRLLAA